MIMLLVVVQTLNVVSDGVLKPTGAHIGRVRKFTAIGKWDS